MSLNIGVALKLVKSTSINSHTNAIVVLKSSFIELVNDFSSKIIQKIDYNERTGTGIGVFGPKNWILQTNGHLPQQPSGRNLGYRKMENIKLIITLRREDTIDL